MKKEVVSKEVFYALGKVGESEISFWMNEDDGEGRELFTVNPESAFTWRNAERAARCREQFSELKPLKVIEVTVETIKTYTFAKEI